MSISRTRNYLSSLVTGYTVTALTVAVGLWLTPFTLQFLNREEYAIFTLLSDLLMWLGLLDIGIASSLNVQAAQLTGKPDQEKLNRLASTAFISENIVCLLIIIVGTAVAFLFPHFFEISPEVRRQSVQVALLMVTGVALNFFILTFSALLVAYQQIYVDNLIRIFLIVIRTALTVVLLLSGWKIFSLAVANLAALIITAILAIIRVKHLLPNLEIKRKWFSWDVLKSTVGLGIWFGLGGLAGMVIVNLDRIVTAKLISVELVTTLSLTGRVYTLFGGLLQQIPNNARPILGQLLGSGKLEEAFQRYRQIFIISTGMTIVVSTGLLSINGSFVTLWVGKENYGGFWLDLALALNMIVHAWVLPNRAVLSSNLVVRPQTLSRLVEGILNITLSVFLAIKMGMLGVVLSTAIAGFVTSNWYLPRLTMKMFDRPYKDFLLGDGLRLILFAAFSFSIVFGIRTMFFQNIQFVQALLVSILVVLFSLMLFWFFVLELPLRQSAMARVQKVIGFKFG